MTRSNQSLNQRKSRLSVSVTPCCSSRAHSAGVRVSATIPDSTTAITMVTANCLYMAPVMPPMNATGMNTEHSTSTIATRAPLTCRMARSAATLGLTCSVSMMRSTFSMTTMASSTTMPMASTSPNRVRVLTENPSADRPRKVPTMLTGTASTGMIVARQLCRNRNTTRVTSSIASPRVLATSRMDSVMNGVVSNGRSQRMPAGNALASSFIRATTAFFTSSALAPGRV